MEAQKKLEWPVRIHKSLTFGHWVDALVVLWVIIIEVDRWNITRFFCLYLSCKLISITKVIF